MNKRIVTALTGFGLLLPDITLAASQCTFPSSVQSLVNNNSTNENLPLSIQSAILTGIANYIELHCPPDPSTILYYTCGSGDTFCSTQASNWLQFLQTYVVMPMSTLAQSPAVSAPASTPAPAPAPTPAPAAPAPTPAPTTTEAPTPTPVPAPTPTPTPVPTPTPTPTTTTPPPATTTPPAATTPPATTPPASTGGGGGGVDTHKIKESEHEEEESAATLREQESGQ